jgi:hypothetical protein
MVWFLTMKKLAALVARFLVIFAIAEICISLVWSTIVSLEQGAGVITSSLYTVAMMSVPASMVTAAFLAFFLLNRLYASRLTGYPALFITAALAMAGASMLHRFVGAGLLVPVPALSPGYTPVAGWFIATAVAPWPQYAAGMASFTAFVCGFWAVTRVARGRPIFGAFLAPSAALAALHLFSMYLSGPADALFKLAGFNAPRPWYSILLTSGTAAVLLLADVLIADRPAGGARQ